MAETVHEGLPPAPTISPVPPDDRRRARAAGRPTRRLSPTASDMASGTRPHPPFECIALLLQGGGGLGAYQAGVYEALAEADLHGDWIAGISIGAINGALIAGNPPELRVDRLRAFWERVTHKPCCDWGERMFLAKSDAVRRWQNQVSAYSTLLFENLPETLRNGSEAQLLQPLGDHKVYNIVHLIYRAKNYEGQSKDYDFSRASMEEHWRAGYHDAIRALRHPEVLERPTDHDGGFTFDLLRDGRE